MTLLACFLSDLVSRVHVNILLENQRRMALSVILNEYLFISSCQYFM